MEAFFHVFSILLIIRIREHLMGIFSRFCLNVQVRVFCLQYRASFKIKHLMGMCVLYVYMQTNTHLNVIFADNLYVMLVL